MGSGQSHYLDGLSFLDASSVGCKGKRESKVDAKLLRLMQKLRHVKQQKSEVPVMPSCQSSLSPSATTVVSGTTSRAKDEGIKESHPVAPSAATISHLREAIVRDEEFKSD